VSTGKNRTYSRLRRPQLFAILLGFAALAASYVILLLAYNHSVDNAEESLYDVYTEKARYIKKIIESNNEKSKEEILQIVQEAFEHAGDHPWDEYVCIVDASSVLLLHTRHPETVGENAGDNRIQQEGKTICTLSDLMAGGTDYTGNYISSDGEEQIAAFEYVPSMKWSVGVHRSEKALTKEVREQFSRFVLVFMIITGLLIPLALVILYRISSRSHLKRIESEHQTQDQLRKAKEKAELDAVRIREQQKLFETMFNTIEDAVIITKTDREIILANEGVRNVFGLDPAELPGHKTSILYADDKMFEDAGKSVFGEDAPKSDENFLTFYKDSSGNVFPGETFGSKLYNDKGKWIGNLGVVRNVTERVNFIKELEEAKEKAEESDRLKTRFLANLSHEIRTPMNGILGFAQLLKRQDVSRMTQEQYIDTILNSGKRMLNLINDLVDISKIESGQVSLDFSGVQLNSIMDETFRFFERETKALGLMLDYHKGLADDESYIRTDKVKLEQILSNLLRNAIKFTEEGAVHFRYDREGDMLLFRVSDTGPGISKDLIEVIFDRFIKTREGTRNNEGGSGLGLAISKSFVELMGGTIWVDSEPGKGAVFSFSIPYKPIEDEKVSSADEPGGNIGQVKIAVAEDDDISYFYIQEILSEMEVELVRAKNGLELVNLFRIEEDFNLIIMDIKMPVMDGWDALEKIREINPEIPVIIESAFASEQDRNRAEQLGCSTYLTKPLDPGELIEAIRSQQG